MLARRKKLNLDVDGVLADFAAAVCEHVYTVTGRRYNPNVIRTWEVFDSLPEPPSVQAEVYARLKAEGGCSSIPVIDGAKDAVNQLNEIVDITIVTSPFYGSKTWVYERSRWLHKHFGVSVDHVIHAKRKHAIHADFFLDDKESHVRAWEAYWRAHGHSPVGLLWHTNRNTDPHPDTKVVTNWADVIQLVRVHVEANT